MHVDQRFSRREFVGGSLASASTMAWAHPHPARVANARRWKFGVVGCGARSRGTHLPLLRDYFPEVEVVALCNVTPENLEQGREVYGKPVAIYGDYHEMLSAQPDLDAVVVVGPNCLHAPVAVAALEAGKHVLTEKPIATHVADATRMLDTAKRQQRILAVGFEMRYSLLFHRMSELLGQGVIGEVELVPTLMACLTTT